LKNYAKKPILENVSKPDRSEVNHYSQSVFWASLSRQERREFTRARNQCARTWMFGQERMLADVNLREARELYNQNWDGCRDCWKQNYQQEKEKAFAPEVKL
jgi:hypothetical protein